MSDDIIDLSAYRATKQDHGERCRTCRIEAKGHDDIEIEFSDGDDSSGTWATTRDGIRMMIRAMRKALNVASTWDMDKCPAPACEAKGCRRWHSGLLLEDYDGSRHWVDGMTMSGRWRIRAMDGGKIRYSRATSPLHVGRIVGFVDIASPPAR